MDLPFYWELTLMNGDKIPIPPEYVETVKQKMANKENLVMNRQIIPSHQITNFEQTSRIKRDPTLIEDVARAFSEPIVNERKFVDGTGDEAVAAKWVKKQVSQKEWGKYYSGSPGYKLLSNEGGVVTMACIVPTHLINYARVQDCNAVEIAQLTK